MNSTIYKQLESLTDEEIQTLLKDDAVVLCLFRNLLPLAQQLLLFTLNIDKKFFKNSLSMYSMTKGSRETLEEALRSLKNLRLIQLEPTDKGDGKSLCEYIRVNSH